jgi:sugar phosphate isomerase/epimerase
MQHLTQQPRCYSRRSFLRSTATLTSALALSATPLGTSLAQSRQVERPGLQLYTLRNEMAADFPGTLARVAELGYREMEFAGYFERSPAQVRTLLDANGLTSPAAHIPLNAVRDNLDAMIESAHTLGQRYIVIPFLQPNERSYDDYQRLIETLNSAGEAARAAGLKLGYHNHDFEFVESNGQIPYDMILEQTDPALVDIELDLYWISRAGVDPLPYFEQHPGRFTMLHVKDMGTNGEMVDVGHGTINFAAIFSHQQRAGFEHFFVEHDRPADGLVSVARSIDSLSKLRYLHRQY